MENEKASDLELVQAEVAAEELPEGAVVVPLGDDTVTVLHPDDWPSSANEDLQRGRFISWASKALASDEDVKKWTDIDPTNREAAAFFTAWGEASGSTVGESRASRRSSARTRGNLKAI